MICLTIVPNLSFGFTVVVGNSFVEDDIVLFGNRITPVHTVDSGHAIGTRLKNLYENILYSGISNFIILVDRAMFGQYETEKKVTQIVT